MAETTAKPGKAKAPEQPEEPREPTRRVVLRRERVLVIPESVTDEVLREALKGVKLGAEKRLETAIKETPVEAWLVVGEFEGAGKEDAIEAHAGTPGTPDAIPGAYKAPTVRAFAGGALYEAPPKPLVQRRALD